MEWLRKVLDWDESQDPTATSAKVLLAPWRMLGYRDKQLLDLLADGIWTHERLLRKQLHWSRARFFITTTRMVIAGWIEVRPVNSFFESEYRLSQEAWR